MHDDGDFFCYSTCAIYYQDNTVSTAIVFSRYCPLDSSDQGPFWVPRKEEEEENELVAYVFSETDLTCVCTTGRCSLPSLWRAYANPL